MSWARQKAASFLQGSPLSPFGPHRKTGDQCTRFDRKWCAVDVEPGDREMQLLIEDIERNGEATTPEEAKSRPVPEFDVSALRDCPTG